MTTAHEAAITIDGRRILSKRQLTEVSMTISEVAIALGVSIDAVAFALNNILNLSTGTEDSLESLSFSTHRRLDFIELHKKPCTGNDFINKKINKRKPRWQK